MIPYAVNIVLITTIKDKSFAVNEFGLPSKSIIS